MDGKWRRCWLQSLLLLLPSSSIWHSGVDIHSDVLAVLLQLQQILELLAVAAPSCHEKPRI
jgi:hypothetical protein